MSLQLAVAALAREEKGKAVEILQYAIDAAAEPCKKLPNPALGDMRHSRRKDTIVIQARHDLRYQSHSKSVVRKDVWVQVPPPVLKNSRFRSAGMVGHCKHNKGYPWDTRAALMTR